MMRVEIVEPKLFAGTIADELVALIGESVEERGVCCLSLAGGKTPGQVYRALALPPRAGEIPWGRVKLFLGDERWVSHDSASSNFRMVHEALISHLRGPVPTVFHVDTTLDEVTQGAQQYSDVMVREVARTAEGIPAFDVMILGLGEDGHTASLFPGSPLLRQHHTAFSVAAQNPHDDSHRVTVTPDVIRNAKNIIFIVKGMNKADICKLVLEGSDSVDTHPARIFAEVSDRVTWFLDSEAASKLTPGKFV